MTDKKKFQPRTPIEIGRNMMYHQNLIKNALVHALKETPDDSDGVVARVSIGDRDENGVLSYFDFYDVEGSLNSIDMEYNVLSVNVIIPKAYFLQALEESVYHRCFYITDMYNNMLPLVNIIDIFWSEEDDLDQRVPNFLSFSGIYREIDTSEGTMTQLDCMDRYETAALAALAEEAAEEEEETE